MLRSIYETSYAAQANEMERIAKKAYALLKELGAVLHGSFAIMRVHGLPRLPRDIDFFVPEIDEKSLHRIAEELADTFGSQRYIILVNRAHARMGVEIQTPNTMPKNKIQVTCLEETNIVAQQRIDGIPAYVTTAEDKIEKLTDGRGSFLDLIDAAYLGAEIEKIAQNLPKTHITRLLFTVDWIREYIPPENIAEAKRIWQNLCKRLGIGPNKRLEEILWGE